jgi:hypothetical protein
MGSSIWNPNLSTSITKLSHLLTENTDVPGLPSSDGPASFFRRPPPRGRFGTKASAVGTSSGPDAQAWVRPAPLREGQPLFWAVSRDRV